MKTTRESIIRILKADGVGILPTDTVHGLIGRALSKKAVERLYELKKRDGNKPFIILISSLNVLKNFGIKKAPKILEEIWPAPLSVIFDCPLKKWQYLHRNTNSLSFRVPKNKFLLEILKVTGPLVAPSANLQGKKTIESIEEARQTFGEKIDFCLIKQTKRSNKPSTIVKFDAKEQKFSLVRKGAFNFKSDNTQSPT